MAQLAAQSPGTFQKAAAGKDAAAHTCAQRYTNDICIAFCCAGPDFAQGHTVGVVCHYDRQMEHLLQRSLDGAAI